jgi:hypothetical protein
VLASLAADVLAAQADDADAHHVHHVLELRVPLQQHLPAPLDVAGSSHRFGRILIVLLLLLLFLVVVFFVIVVAAVAAGVATTGISNVRMVVTRI